MVPLSKIQWGARRTKHKTTFDLEKYYTVLYSLSLEALQWFLLIMWGRIFHGHKHSFSFTLRRPVYFWSSWSYQISTSFIPSSFIQVLFGNFRSYLFTWSGYSFIQVLFENFSSYLHREFPVPYLYSCKIQFWKNVWKKCYFFRSMLRIFKNMCVNILTRRDCRWR